MRFLIRPKFCRSLTLLLVSLTAINGSGQNRPSPGTESKLLKIGHAIERTLKGAEKHTYEIRLESAQFVEVVVNQRGVDVTVTLLGPAGENLREVDSPNGTEGPEPLSWVAGSTGTYRFEVRALESNAPAGRYEVKLLELRAAVPMDRPRVSAEMAVVDAVTLRNAGSPEQLRKAIQRNQEAATLWRESGERAKEAQAYVRIGSIHFSLNEFPKALEFYGQALQLQRSIADRAGEAATLNHIGMVHSALEEPQKALDLYNQALLLHRTAANRAGEANALYNIGSVYESLGQDQKAVEFYDQALPHYRVVNDSVAEAMTLNRMGILYRSLGDSQKALGFYRQALTVLESRRDKRGQAQTLNRIGVAYGSLNQHSLALESYKQALQLSQEVGERDGQATSANNIGTAYESLGEKQKALEFYDQALTLYRTLGDRKREARTLFSIGNVHDALGEKKKALDSFELALPILRVVGDQVTEATTLTKLGTISSSQGHNEKAIEYYDRALAIFHALDNRSLEAATLLARGVVYMAQNQRAMAVESFNQALTLARATGEKVVQAHALTYLGLTYNLLGDKPKALDFYSEALALHRVSGDRDGQVITLNTMAVVHNSRGDKRRALECLNETLSIVQAGGDRSLEAFTQANIGAVYYWLGEKSRALESLNKALSLSKAVNARNFEAFTLGGIGFVYELQGDYQKAGEHFLQALLLSRAIGDRLNEAYALLGIGVVDSSLDQNQRALESLNQARKQFQAVGYRFGEAYALSRIGKVNHALGLRQEALDSLNQALLLAREDNEGDVEGYTLPLLMSLWRSLDKPRLAILYGKQAINVYQQIRTNIRELDKGLQKGFLLSKEDTYRQLADLLISEERLPEAQQVLGLLKEEEYFQFVRRESTTAALLKRTDLTPEELAAIQRYELIGNRLGELARELNALKAKGTPPDDKRYQELTIDLEAANRAFQVFLRELAEEFGKQDEKGKQIVRSIQEDKGLQSDFKQWGSGVVALHTVVGENNYRVILTTPSLQVAREAVPKIKGTDLNRLVLEFREAVQNPSVDPRPLGQKLYQILLGPVAKDLEAANAKTLIWSLDGTLRYVPIAALHDGQQYVVERYQNVIITLASRTRLHAPSGAWRGLGLGVSKGIVTREGEAFRPLPAVPNELRGIVREESQKRQRGGVIPGTVMLDEAFTFKAMEGALRQGRYPLVHIASHFSFKPGNETNSFLLLGDGNRLTLDKIRISASPFFDGVQLLTLSACDTATGGAANGREVEGFAVLAQEQGAQAVLATLWPVADQSTQDLMIRFYKSRVAARAMTKAEALRQAQLALLRGGERGSSRSVTKAASQPFAHPYFWSPFILIGNWR